MRILVIRMDLLGDAIVSGTFLESLKTHIPDAKLDILCHEGNFNAFRYHPDVGNIYTLKHLQGSKLLASDLLLVIAEINDAVCYDLVIVLNGCARTYHYANLINKKKLIVRKLFTKSFKAKLLMSKMIYLKKVIFFTESLHVHEVVRLNDYCQFILGNLGLNIKVDLPTQAKFYPEHNFTYSKIVKNSVVINVSGKKNQARYINDSLIYALLSEFSKLNYTISIVLMNDDLVRLQNVLNSLTNKVNLINDNDLFKVAKLMSLHEYYIGVDGGLTHVAAGVGLKCITLFDRQDNRIWHPWTEWQISLQSEHKNIYDISYLDIVELIKNW